MVSLNLNTPSENGGHWAAGSYPGRSSVTGKHIQNKKGRNRIKYIILSPGTRIGPGGRRWTHNDPRRGMGFVSLAEHFETLNGDSNPGETAQLESD